MLQQSPRNPNGRKSSLFGATRHSSKPSSASLSSVTSPSPAQACDNSPPYHAVSPRHRHSSSVTSGDFAAVTATLRRSLSLRSITAPVRSVKLRSPSSTTFSHALADGGPQPSPQASKSLFSLSSIGRKKSSDHAKDLSLHSSSDRSRPSTAVAMAATAVYRNPPLAKTPSNAPSALGVAYTNGGMANPSAPPVASSGSLTPQATYQTILDTASKRISTLDYLRKASVILFSYPAKQNPLT